jgi:hypothetical protein
VIQDPRRAADLPIARLYYLEQVQELESQIEKEVRMKRVDFSDSELSAWKSLRAMVKEVVWNHYTALVGAY